MSCSVSFHNNTINRFLFQKYVFHEYFDKYPLGTNSYLPRSGYMGGHLGADFVIRSGCGTNAFTSRSALKGRTISVTFHFYWIGFRCDGAIRGI